MLLTDKKIREMAEKNELITPFKEENLQSESYDVTLGHTVIALKKEVYCLDIANQMAIDNIYEEIDISNDGYIISPKEYVMVSLAENINIPNNISAHIRPKTRYSRLGLIVNDQHCNSTYCGNLKLALYNATNYPIKIRAGFTIAQLIFDELNEIPSENKLYKNKETAHYQDENGNFRGAKFDDEFLDDIIDDIFTQHKDK